jgi:hypothetical protein
MGWIYNTDAYVLTPWCKTLFEKLIVTQVVKNILLSLWNQKVHYRVHKSPPLYTILSQLNPVRPIDPCLPKAQLNVIFSPTPRTKTYLCLIKHHVIKAVGLRYSSTHSLPRQFKNY